MAKRSIGNFTLLCTAISGIIGSGWLFGPYYAAQVAGPAALLSWILGGFLMILIALTFAELASMLPIVGGVARFAHFSHGTFVSYAMSWCGWISSIVVAPIETMALLQYASTYFPALSEKVGATHELSSLGIKVAAALMLVMCIINSLGSRLLTKTNTPIAIIKVAVPVLTAVFLLSKASHWENFYSLGFAPYGLKGILSALPTAGVIFSFIGYSPAIMLAGEAKRPQKAIFFAIIGSLLIGIAIYCLVQVAFITNVEPFMINKGWSGIQFSGDSGPFAGIAMSLGLAWLAFFLFLDAVISPFGTALIYTASAARMNFAMSKNGYMPASMQLLNKHQSPVFAIFTNYFLGLLLFLPFPGWQSMVTFLVLAFVLSYAVGPISCASLRKIMPDAERPFKLPYEKFFANSAFYVCNLLAYWTGWQTYLKLLIVLLIGFVGLFVFRATCKSKIEPLHFRSGIWLFPYYLGLGLISYLGSFGGGRDILTFGWDFLVILIFSLIIFKAAKLSRIQKVCRPYEARTDVPPTI